MNATAVDAASPPSRFSSLAIDALRGIRARQIGAAMLLGLALSAWGWAAFMAPISKIAQTMPLGRMLLQLLITDQVKALCLLVAIVIADRAVDEGAQRRRTYLVAALAGCVAGIALTEPFHWFWRTYMLPDRWPASFTWLHGTMALFYWPIFFLTQWLLVGSAVVFLYADRRAARRTTQLLHDAELDRIRRSRRALESRLQAMQARVEPEFLFNTLDQVERLYDRDVVLASMVRASRMLDDLIAYLRAAMPQMRDTSSTVGQEIELARAYLNITRLRMDGRLDVDVVVAEGVAGARMPPMMLLPLVERALARCGEAARITVAASQDMARLRVVVACSAPASATLDDDALALSSIEERLAGLYEKSANLTMTHPNAGTVEVRIELPLEFAVAPQAGVPAAVENSN